MRSGLVLFLACYTAVAQMTQRSPMDELFQSYHKARNEGRFEDAAGLRDKARDLVNSLPLDSSQYTMWLQNVASMYESGGRYVQARALSEQALSRAAGLGENHPTRLGILLMLSNQWQQDQNILKTAEYLERAAAAMQKGAPPAPAVVRNGDYPPRILQINGRRPFMSYDSQPSPVVIYQRLAEVYRELGRPEAAAEMINKLRSRAGAADPTLANSYIQEGQFEEAAAVYRQQIAQAGGDPQLVAGGFTSLSSLYQQQQDYPQAAAMLQQAISTLETSGRPELQNQSHWLRQNLAGVYQQAGDTGAADKVFQQLLSDTRSGDPATYLGMLLAYANYLSFTKRAAQAETILLEHQSSHPSQEAWQDANLYMTLANVARNAGNPKKADEYQRAGIEKQKQANIPPPAETNLIGPAFSKLHEAAQKEMTDALFSQTLQLLKQSPQCMDRDSVSWMVPEIAERLAAKKKYDQADQLYQSLLSTVTGWTVETLQPLVGTLQRYAQFLSERPDRQNEALSAIERYRQAVIESRGEHSGLLESALHMRIQLERSRNAFEPMLRAGQERVELEESLSGPTSEPYLQAIQGMAELYETAGTPERAKPLLKQMVAIADLVFTKNNLERGYTRITVAHALARLQQYDEAERLAKEAVAIGQSLRPPQPNAFTADLEQIRNQKENPTGTRGGISKGQLVIIQQLY